jgi:hypothetical protein
VQDRQTIARVARVYSSTRPGRSGRPPSRGWWDWRPLRTRECSRVRLLEKPGD